LDREQIVMPKIEDHHIAAAQLAIKELADSRSVVVG
jgi:hypothetical protein